MNFKVVVQNLTNQAIAPYGLDFLPNRSAEPANKTRVTRLPESKTGTLRVAVLRVCEVIDADFRLNFST